MTFAQYRGDQIEKFENLSEFEKEQILKRLMKPKKKIGPVPADEPKDEALVPGKVPEEEDVELVLPKTPQIPPPLSEIEKIMSGQYPIDISRELRLFGYDFFTKTPPSFSPITKVPVGPAYIIGPGDHFTINLWGKVEKTYEVIVTRDGRITLPRLGTLSVTGLSFSELKDYLFSKFKEYYPGFKISITMGRLRTIEIFIVGEAKSPGTYSASSLSTVITVLFGAGGPTKKGSLREIKVFRNNRLIETVDLYDFFIKGTDFSNAY